MAIPIIPLLMATGTAAQLYSMWRGEKERKKQERKLEKVAKERAKGYRKWSEYYKTRKPTPLFTPEQRERYKKQLSDILQEQAKRQTGLTAEKFAAMGRYGSGVHARALTDLYAKQEKLLRDAMLAIDLESQRKIWEQERENEKMMIYYDLLERGVDEESALAQAQMAIDRWEDIAGGFERLTGTAAYLYGLQMYAPTTSTTPTTTTGTTPITWEQRGQLLETPTLQNKLSLYSLGGRVIPKSAFEITPSPQPKYQLTSSTIGYPTTGYWTIPTK